MTAAPDLAAAPLAQAPDALADLARVERFFEALTTSLAERQLVRLVLSKPRPGGSAGATQLQRITAKPVQIKGQPRLSLLFQHATKDITQNPGIDDALAQIRGWLGTDFSHAHLHARNEALQLSYSKRGKVALHRARVVASGEDAPPEDPADVPQGDGPDKGHTRQKRYLLPLDTPFLAALGVTDVQRQLVPAMARKWRQINKFAEVLDHALTQARVQPGEAGLRVVDFGAGKGYLTFAAHHLLTVGRGWPADVLGVELRPDLVAQCQAAVQRCGLHGLRFECGDVRTVVPAAVDVMIALHACDTATDHALHTGIRAGAAVILSSPCCHKQLRPQLQLPPLLKPMLQHGIHLGQQAEMLTDSLRALLLEASGYSAQVFEFISPEHTSKNKMILATRRPERAPGEAARRATAWAQVAALKAHFGVQAHCLESLLHAQPDSLPPS